MAAEPFEQQQFGTAGVEGVKLTTSDLYIHGCKYRECVNCEHFFVILFFIKDLGHTTRRTLDLQYQSGVGLL